MSSILDALSRREIRAAEPNAHHRHPWVEPERGLSRRRVLSPVRLLCMGVILGALSSAAIPAFYLQREREVPPVAKALPAVQPALPTVTAQATLPPAIQAAAVAPEATAETATAPAAALASDVAAATPAMEEAAAPSETQPAYANLWNPDSTWQAISPEEQAAIAAGDPNYAWLNTPAVDPSEAYGFAQAPIGSAPQQPEMMLTATLGAGERSMAIIDGRIMHVGDTVGGGYVLSEIGDGWVRVAGWPEKISLYAH